MENTYRFVELDIGGLGFVTTKEVTPELIVEFLNNHKPSHVYTNAVVVAKYQVRVNIMGEDDSSVRWRTSSAEGFQI